jgi:hypothetical protein
MQLLRNTPIVLVLLLALGLGACVEHDRSAQPQTPDDNYDQQGWANTSPDGPGSETSNAYYGVGASDGPGEHQPASPRAQGHKPY